MLVTGETWKYKIKTFVYDDKFNDRLPKFNGTNQDHFQIWTIRIRAALKSRDLSAALTENDVEKINSETKLNIITIGFGNNPLRAVQSCKIAKTTGDEL